METLVSILENTYNEMTLFMGDMFPKAAATIIVVVGGLLIARTAKSLVHMVCTSIRFENFADRIGLADVLRRAEVEQNSSEIMGTIVYWTGLIFTALAALGTMGVADASVFGTISVIIPQVILAVAILVLGINVAFFVAKVIQTACVNAEVRQARLVRNVAYYTMVTLVVLSAVKQLGISAEILETSFFIFFSGTCLAAAIAFGMGSRDLAGSITKDFWKTETSRAESLSQASELGHDVIPMSSGPKKRRRKTA